MFRATLVKLGIIKPGSYRWDVKTGCDSDAAAIVWKPRIMTIAHLYAIKAPRAPRGRVVPHETQIVAVTGRLTSAHLESDGDYHLVIEDDKHRTLIGEIPDPTLCPQSVWAARITDARTAFDTTVHSLTAEVKSMNSQVTITGPLFFDVRHGQTGVAPNGIELHPVLRFQVH
jgi:hypothetical protein